MESTITPEMRSRILQEILSTGFSGAGIANASSLEIQDECERAERFIAWIDAGRAGEMNFMKRTDAAGRLMRSSLSVALPWARSIIVCALSYNVEAPLSIEDAPANSGWIARYAWSGEPGQDGAMNPTDYHDVMLRKLEHIEEALRAELPDPEMRTRCYVDTGPIVERDYAQRSGVGWIGKNTCLINESLGSWLLLGVIVTSASLLEDVAQLGPDRCGSCTRCIDACPTHALVGERQMDANLCIAYLTIEAKGAIPEELRTGMGRQVFGCDICQDVCPWNRKSPVFGNPEMQLREKLVNPDLEWLGGLSNAEFRAVFDGSPLQRTGLKRLRRNVAVAMGNSGLERYRPLLTKWSEGEDPVLAETAVWALSRLKVSHYVG